MRLFIPNVSFASIELSSVYQSHVVKKREKSSKIRTKFYTSRKLLKCWTTKRGQRWIARKSGSHRRSKNNSSHMEIDYFPHTIVHSSSKTNTIYLFITFPHSFCLSLHCIRLDFHNQSTLSVLGIQSCHQNASIHLSVVWRVLS